MKQGVIRWVYSVVGCLFILLIAYGLLPKPELVKFTTYSKAFTDRNDKLLRITLAKDDRYRLYTPLDKISNNLKTATILYEDKTYYQHHGIDFTALIRAFWVSYITQQRRIGASTITMQVARLRWGISSNNIRGKLCQLFRAIQLTRHYSKETILEAYLNLAPYGRNIEGIGAASLIYFNKSANDLSLPEALTLAVIPQNPNKRLPTTSSGVSSLNTARKNLFDKWLTLYPEADRYKKFIDLPLNARSIELLPFMAPHFLNYLTQKESSWHTGLIKTSLDNQKQQRIESIIREYINSHSTIGIHNAAALLLNYKTMKIESMVGSADFYSEIISGQVNGVLAKRSPGSTLKPFVYGLAIDEGLIHPMTLLKDSPKRFAGFTPENYDKKFLGPILASDALITSRNVPAVNLQAKLKSKNFYQFLKSAGITQLKKESFYGLALALGGGELSMLELVKLYALLANRGQLQEVSGLFDEKIIHQKQLLSPEASYIILDILKNNPAPVQQYKQFNTSVKNDIAWKTGTSWAFRDAWAIGVSGNYVLAVWVGNFDGSSNNAFIGRNAAGPLLFSLFNALVPQQAWTIKKHLFSPSLNLKKVAMCKNTGDLPSQHCPNRQSSWFIPGVSPLKVETVYRTIAIDQKTGLRACSTQSEGAVQTVYELWPSDFLSIFKQAGISLKTPPAYHEECQLDQKSTYGQYPVIYSPQSTVQYVLSNNQPSSNIITFSATVDSDARKIFWFIDEQFAGSSPADQSFFWEGRPGHFTIRAVDDLGRSSSQTLTVITQ